MTWRIWPSSTCFCRTSRAVLNWSSVKSFGDVHALAQHDQPDRVAHLGEDHDLALEVRRPEVVERLELAADLVLAVADAGVAALPGHRELAAGVEADVLQRGVQVAGVRDLGLVELLDVALPDQAAGHPVGQRDDVLADVVAVAQLPLDLAVVRVVVVDVLGVGGLDARVGLELLQRRVVLGVLVVVEVGGPVGPAHHLVGGRLVLDGGLRLRLAAGLRGVARAARGERGGDPDPAGAPEDGAAGQLRAHQRLEHRVVMSDSVAGAHAGRLLSGGRVMVRLSPRRWCDATPCERRRWCRSSRA